MSARPRLADTREKILAAAAQLLADQGIPVTIAKVTLIDACRRAGLKTAGSGYKIWETQDEFRADLLRHLIDQTTESTPTLDTVTSMLDGDDPPSFTELIRLVSSANFVANAMSQTHQLYYALWLAAGQDPDAARELAASDAEWLDSFARVYELAAEVYDREFVPPFDASLLATTLAALADGLVMRTWSHPDRVPAALPRPTGPEGEIQRWHLYACGVDAIVAAFTRPRR